MTSAPAISVRQLDYRLGNQTILQSIHMDIEAGAFVGVIGPNGAGKTTLFRLILGLISPTCGEVLIFGKTPETQREIIGYVPQLANFQRDFPIIVEEAVLCGCTGKNRWWGGFRAQERENARAIMADLSIENLAKRPIARLSGGEMQRVLLARALVSRPRILLLDEPTANVDNFREEEIFTLLARINPQPTILLISHDLGFITPMVHRVACLHRTLSFHTPQEISPQTIHALYGHPVHAVPHHH